MGKFTNSTIIGLVQANQPLNHGRYYLPYSAGVLETYVRQNAEDTSGYMFLPPVYKKFSFKTVWQEFQLADIVGFCTYTWNSEYSLALAHYLKQKNPEVLIVFGGPHVPDDSEDFLRKHPFIDLCCHGEGEQVFLKVLEAFPQRNWQGIPSISYLDESGHYHRSEKIARLKDINCIPSPYLTGVFYPLMKKYPYQKWSVLWETNRGCPFSCTFCDWGSAVNSKLFRFEDQRLLDEIEWFAKQKIHTVFVCDANFGIIKRDLMLTDTVVKSKQDKQFPHTFMIQTTKNVTDRAYEIVKALYDADLNQFVTLSLQSLNTETLIHIKRDNISLDTYRELQRRFSRDGVTTYTDILIGLPGETYDSFANGVDQIIREGQYNLIQYYNVYLLPNAEMAQSEYRQKYQIETVEVPYVFSEAKAEDGQPLPIEIQEMIISTSTMSSQDWVRMRVFSWYSNLLPLHRRLLQIPFILMHKLVGMTYREIFEAYMNVDEEFYLLKDIGDFFFRTAQNVLKGISHFCQTTVKTETSHEIWVEPFDFVMAGLLESKAIDLFYEQNEQFLISLLKGDNLKYKEVLHEGFILNKALFLAQLSDFTFEFPVQHNLWEVYQGVLKGQDIALKAVPSIYYKDWKGTPDFQIKQKALSLR